MKVIIATDGSEAALDGARRGLALVGSNAEVEVTMVIPPRYDPALDEGGFEGPVMTEEQADKQFAGNVQQGEEAIARTVAALGVEARVVLAQGEGSPAERIVELAAQDGADLIIIGSADHGFFSRLLHGSVSEHVVRHAHCPVLVVPHHEAAG